jgi:hypothetical protein
MEGCGLNFSGSGEGAVAGPCEHNIEPLGFVKGSELLDYSSDSLLLKKDSAPWS